MLPTFSRQLSTNRQVPRQSNFPVHARIAIRSSAKIPQPGGNVCKSEGPGLVPQEIDFNEPIPREDKIATPVDAGQFRFQRGLSLKFKSFTRGIRPAVAQAEKHGRVPSQLRTLP